MGFSETLIFYLVVGCVVAVAVYATDEHRSRAGTGLSVAMAVVFWPLYLPLLLSAREAIRPVDPPARQPDAMAAAIADVERELDTALANLDGWAESAVAREKGRIAELRAALSAQARRIREMDALLAGVASSRAAGAGNATGVEPTAGSDPSNIDPGFDATSAGATAPGATATDRAALDRWRRSEQARSQNLARLAAVRRQTHADLMATLAWIRELVSMMHLAKFTGAPASRTEELMAQIAAAVEGVSDAGTQLSDDDRWESPAAADPSAEPVAH